MRQTIFHRVNLILYEMYYSKFYRLFVTPSAPGAVKSVRCAFFFELLELIKTKITSLICSTTVLDKNLDFWN